MNHMRPAASARKAYAAAFRPDRVTFVGTRPAGNERAAGRASGGPTFHGPAGRPAARGALHEAAHAVAVHVLGYRLTRVESRAAVTRWRIPARPSLRDLAAVVIVSMAPSAMGYAAAGGSDPVLRSWALAQLPAGSEALLERGTRELMATVTPDVLALAAELDAAGGSLDGPAVHAFLCERP